jgi:hypothetical protein
MKRLKIITKKLKKKLKEKPMITWNRLALKIMIIVHLLDNGLIVFLNYECDDYIGISMLYLIISNIAIYKAFNILWRW